MFFWMEKNFAACQKKLKWDPSVCECKPVKVHLLAPKQRDAEKWSDSSHWCSQPDKTTETTCLSLTLVIQGFKEIEIQFILILIWFTPRERVLGAFSNTQYVGLHEQGTSIKTGQHIYGVISQKPRQLWPGHSGWCKIQTAADHSGTDSVQSEIVSKYVARTHSFLATFKKPSTNQLGQRQTVTNEGTFTSFDKKLAAL